MKVKFFASFADAAKEKERDFSAPDIKSLFALLIERYGPEFEKMLYPKGTLPDNLIILVNGKHIRHLQGLDTPLQESDVVSIFPMLNGG